MTSEAPQRPWLAFYPFDGRWCRTELPEDAGERLTALMKVWRFGSEAIVIDHDNGKAFLYRGKLIPASYEGYQDWT